MDLDLLGWQAKVANLIKDFKTFILGNVANQVAAWSTTFIKSPPRFDHIVSDEVLMLPLAETTLLKKWKGRDAFADDSVALFDAITRLSEDHMLFGFDEPLLEMFHSSVYSMIENFKFSRKVVKLVSHLEIICWETGEDQRASAIEVLSTPTDMYATVKTKLEEITAIPVAGKGGGRGRGRGRGNRF